MLASTEKSSLKKNLNDLSREISDIKNKLNKINNEKESWFSKYKEIRDKLGPLIRQLKDIKNKKDKTSVSLKNVREQRDKYNKEVQALVAKIKDIYSKKKILFSKLGINYDPAVFRKQIEFLETKIETEVMSLDREKDLMKKIKKLKQNFGKDSEATKLVEEFDAISKELDEKKKKADDFHKRLQILYKENKDFKLFLELSKEINELRNEGIKAFEKFKILKQEFINLNNQLKEKLNSIKDVRGKLSTDDLEISNIRKEEQNKKLEELTKQVEEKLKTKKKLTRDDLLVFQNLKNQ